MITETQYTLTYAPGGGWTSFWSYIPEAITSRIQNRMYSFKNGNLYSHDTNPTHNNFYNEQFTTKVTGVLNSGPSTNKVFKTFNLEADSSWAASMYTDQMEGVIEQDWFQLREGEYYTHIRTSSSEPNYSLRSVQGIGEATINGPSTELDFQFTVGSIISVGDSILRFPDTVGADPELVGVITDISGGVVTHDDSGPATAVDGDFILAAKNEVAESTGVLGHYLVFNIENTQTESTQLFSVGTEVFKSFP